MPRKKLVITACTAALLASGCAGLRQPPAPKAAPPQESPASPRAVATPSPKLAARPVPRPMARPTPRPTPARTATPIPAIRANVTKDGNSLVVARGPAAAPVPLFRQAIVLANVRAAVAGLPAQPQAEFQRGLLTLDFARGSQSEINTAINKALGVPEVTRLRANLPQ